MAGERDHLLIHPPDGKVRKEMRRSGNERELWEDAQEGGDAENYEDIVRRNMQYCPDVRGGLLWTSRSKLAMTHTERNKRAGRYLLASVLAVAAVCVVVLFTGRASSHQQRLALLNKVSLASKNRMQKLSDFTVSGSIDVPEHPPGLGYIKTPPMGKVQVVGRDGSPLGSIQFKTLPAPPGPPPTIIRFGDVSMAPGDCPMCPVLDEEAIKKQKEDIEKNKDYIRTLEHLDEVMGCYTVLGRILKVRAGQPQKNLRIGREDEKAQGRDER
eukprot:766577-Hanusia_phi.AAC.2